MTLRLGIGLACMIYNVFISEYSTCNFLILVLMMSTSVWRRSCILIRSWFLCLRIGLFAMIENLQDSKLSAFLIAACLEFYPELCFAFCIRFKVETRLLSLFSLELHENFRFPNSSSYLSSLLRLKLLSTCDVKSSGNSLFKILSLVFNDCFLSALSFFSSLSNKLG